MTFSVCGAFWQLRKVNLHFAVPSWVFLAPVPAYVRQPSVSNLSASFLSIGNAVYPKHDSKFSSPVKRAIVKDNFWEPNGENELLLWLLQVSNRWPRPAGEQKEEKCRMRPIYQSPSHTIYLEELDTIQFTERNWNCQVSHMGRNWRIRVLPGRRGYAARSVRDQS